MLLQESGVNLAGSRIDEFESCRDPQLRWLVRQLALEPSIHLRLVDYAVFLGVLVVEKCQQLHRLDATVNHPCAEMVAYQLSCSASLGHPEFLSGSGIFCRRHCLPLFSLALGGTFCHKSGMHPIEDKEPIAKARRAAGLTIDEMAVKLGINRSTVIRWEKGEPRIPAAKLAPVADLLGVRKIDLRPDLLAE